MARPRVLIPYGSRYGHLTVIDELPSLRREDCCGSYRQVIVRCDCGCETQVDLRNLRSGNTISCGHVSRSVVGRREKTHA